jgi:signal transduction histidine kinase
MQSALRELADTRAGLVATADAERRRIERDIHDGAQQRLVALGIRVSLADELVDRDPAQAHAMMRTLKDEIDQAVDELRSLAAGIYPAVLTDHGLAPALRELARHASRPVHVDVPATIGRFAPDDETTVYFACSEALQNVAKHAGDAAVSLTLSRSADLVFRVCDDGPGFDAARPTGGRGLANMRDRLTALGGTLTVVSTPGKGTCVGGRIPLRASTER